LASHPTLGIHVSIEQRQSRRHHVKLAAVAELRLECAVCDVSQTGARLTVNYPELLPQQFILDVDRKVQRWCRVLWRSGNEVGVQFTADPRVRTRVLL